MIQVGNTLTLSKKDALVALLIEFKDVFTWSYEDMLRIDTDIVQHCIPTDPTMKPVKQKLRRMNLDGLSRSKKRLRNSTMQDS